MGENIILSCEDVFSMDENIILSCEGKLRTERSENHFIGSRMPHYINERPNRYYTTEVGSGSTIVPKPNV